VKGKFQEKIVNTRHIKFFRNKANRKRGEGYFLHAEVCWSNGALRNIKFQYSMTKTGLEFGNSVIVICLIFEICDLEFLFLKAGPWTGPSYTVYS